MPIAAFVADQHVMLCAEPWFTEPELTPDLIVARGGREAEWLSDASPRLVSGGWVSRSSRLRAVGAHLDGDVNRDRSEAVVLVRAPGDRMGPGFVPVQSVLGEDTELVAGPRCGAPPDALLAASLLPVRIPSAAAVIVSGSGIPMDAVLAGVPVVSVGEAALPDPITAARLEALPSVLPALEVGPVGLDDADWSARHLELVTTFLR